MVGRQRRPRNGVGASQVLRVMDGIYIGRSSAVRLLDGSVSVIAAVTNLRSTGDSGDGRLEMAQATATSDCLGGVSVSKSKRRPLHIASVFSLAQSHFEISGYRRHVDLYQVEFSVWKFR